MTSPQSAPPPYPAPAPPAQSSTGRTLLIVAIVVSTILTGLCVIGALGAGLAHVGVSNNHTVVLSMTVLPYAPAEGIDVTYGVVGSQEQELDRAAPWSRTLSLRGGQSVVLLGRNRGDGTIVCSIEVDGKVVKSGRSVGKYAGVTCSTRV
jgi:hypothetical protein